MNLFYFVAALKMVFMISVPVTVIVFAVVFAADADCRRRELKTQSIISFEGDFEHETKN